MQSANELVKETLRTGIMNLLQKCTWSQKLKFKLLYPNGIEDLDEEKLRTAYNLCIRTVEKNKIG